MKQSDETKTTLHFLTLDLASLWEPHLVCQTAMGDTYVLDWVVIKAMLLTSRLNNQHGRHVHYTTADKLAHHKLCLARSRDQGAHARWKSSSTDHKIRRMQQVGCWGVPDVCIILDHTWFLQPVEDLERVTPSLCIKLHCQKLQALNTI